jgi:excisionase family DNA binding protein
MSASPAPLTVDIPTALKLTGLGRSFLYERLSDGSIQSCRAGKRRLVSYASLRAYIASLPTDGLTAKENNHAR